MSNQGYLDYVKENQVELFKYAEENFNMLMLKNTVIDDEYFEKLESWLKEKYSHKKQFFVNYMNHCKSDFHRQIQFNHFLVNAALDFSQNEHKEYSIVSGVMNNMLPEDKTKCDINSPGFDYDFVVQEAAEIQKILRDVPIVKICMYMYQYMITVTNYDIPIDESLTTEIRKKLKNHTFSQNLPEIKKRLFASQ